MHITKTNELVEYSPNGHYNMVARRAHGKDIDDTKILTIGRSEFNPGGGAEASAVKDNMELVYYIVEGTMTLTCEEKDYELNAGDSVMFKSGEVRSVKNNTDKNAVMLVIAGVN